MREYLFSNADVVSNRRSQSGLDSVTRQRSCDRGIGDPCFIERRCDYFHFLWTVRRPTTLQNIETVHDMPFFWIAMGSSASSAIHEPQSCTTVED